MTMGAQGQTSFDLKQIMGLDGFLCQEQSACPFLSQYQALIHSLLPPH